MCSLAKSNRVVHHSMDQETVAGSMSGLSNYLKEASIFCLLPLLFFFTSCGNSGGKSESSGEAVNTGTEVTETTAGMPATAAKRKYGIKSGIVTYESTGMGFNLKVVLYFDDFGAKEAEEKYDINKNIEQTTICDGTNRYTIIYKDKTAQNDGACYNGIAYRFDWEEVAKGDAKYNPQKLANVTIAGKDCESFSLVVSGNTITYAGWNNVCLLIDQATQYGKITYKAVSFEDNPSIPADKFTGPSGFQIK
jgi:hypothetical protein